MRAGKAVQVPKYDFRTNSRIEDECERLEPADVIIVEGILIFYDPELRNIFNMKLFVDADSDIRLARRVERDTQERGRSLDQVLNQYLHSVKPAFEEFCLPTKKYADVVIPRGAENDVAIDLIVQHIVDLLQRPSASAASSSTMNGMDAGSSSGSPCSGLSCSSLAAAGAPMGSSSPPPSPHRPGGGGTDAASRKMSRPH